MTYKNKSFLEDVIILFVIGAIIYALYSFFFNEEEKNIYEETQITIEKNVENSATTNIEEATNQEILKEENPSENIIENKTDNLEENLQEEQNTSINSTNENPEKIDVQEEEKIENTTNEISDAKSFLINLDEKISQDINKNLDKNLFPKGTFTSIRLTVLQDGKYEQLTLMDGNKDYFEAIKPYIKKYFPLKIEDSIKNDFPRYFRMKIENQ